MAQEFDHIILPGWEVVRKLGEGSFGGVYEIRRTLPDGTIERAALKKLTVPKDQTEITELYAQSYDSESITAHFKEQMQDLVREYSFMQKLGENPNVVHCQDLRTVQHDDGIGWDIYIRMELLKPLKIWLTDRYDERQVIRLGLNMCGALHGCHQRNIIHRDIKPENILVNEEGRFKLGDFGIAKVSEKTATGTLTGTYSYMAPEIANRQHYGASADIYSLGLVMYWMMNERTLPFLPLGKKIPSGVQRQEAQDRRFSGEEIPAPINGSLELTRIVLKACAFDPKERYHTVQELAEDLKFFPRYSEKRALNNDAGNEKTPVKVPKHLEVLYSDVIEPSRGKLCGPWVAFKLALSSLVTAILDLFITQFRIIRSVLRQSGSRPTKEITPSRKGSLLDENRSSEKEPPLTFLCESTDTGMKIIGYKGEIPTEVYIPSDVDDVPVTSIGDHVFRNCVNLHTISIPDSVTSIGYSAFERCKNLTSITIPDGVTSIGGRAFWNCTNLRSISIPDSVTSIGTAAFGSCKKLCSISLPQNISSIGNWLFSNCIGLDGIYFSDSLIHIGANAFMGCTSLCRVTIPDSVTSIDSSAFAGCSNLDCIRIPDSVCSIGIAAFEGCIKLKNVTINRKCIVSPDAFPSTCRVDYY